MYNKISLVLCGWMCFTDVTDILSFIFMYSDLWAGRSGWVRESPRTSRRHGAEGGRGLRPNTSSFQPIVENRSAVWLIRTNLILKQWKISLLFWLLSTCEFVVAWVTLVLEIVSQILSSPSFHPPPVASMLLCHGHHPIAWKRKTCTNGCLG